MKNKRWLFILLGILFLINISFYLITRFTRYDVKIIEQITSYIDGRFDTVTAIGSLTLSDKQLHLADIEIIDKNNNFSLNVSHIYFNYNLLQIIFSNFKLSKAVETISIIEPKLTLRITDPPQNDFTTTKGFDFQIPSIPDISDYFENLNVVQGELVIHYNDTQVSYTDIFPDFDLQIINNEKTLVSLNLRREKIAANSEEAEKRAQALSYLEPADKQPVLPALSAEIELQNEELIAASFMLHDYRPTELSLKFLDELDLLIEMEGNFDGKVFWLDGMIRDISGSYLDKEFQGEQIELFSLGDRWFFHSDNLFIDDNRTVFDLELRNILNEPEINLTLSCNRIPLEKYHASFSGKADIALAFSGSLFDPLGKIIITSDSLSLLEENVEDLRLAADYSDRFFTLKLENAVWQNNVVTGEGDFTFKEGLNFQFMHDNLAFQLFDFSFETDLKAELSYKSENFTSQITLSNLKIVNNYLILSEMDLTSVINNDELQAVLSGDRFSLSTFGNLSERNVSSELNLFGLSLNEILLPKSGFLQSYPNLSGSVEFSFIDNIIQSRAAIRMYNLLYGELAGNVQAALAVDFNDNTSSISIETDNTTYHYEPFHLTFSAQGTTDSLRTEEFALNRELHAELLLKTKPHLNFTLDLNGQKLSLSKYFSYFSKPLISNYINGEVDLDLQVVYPEKINGFVTASDVSYKKLGPFNNAVEFSLIREAEQNSFKNETLRYINTLKTTGDTPLVNVTGETVLNKYYDTDIHAYSEDLPLNHIMPNTSLEGLVNAELIFQRTENKNAIEISLEALACSFNWNDFFIDHNGSHSSIVVIDTLRLTAFQSDQVLNISEFFAVNNDLFTVKIEGNLGYNVFRNRIYDIEDQIAFRFQGDLLKALSESFPILESGYSNTDIEVFFGIREDELSVMKGNFSLSDGTLLVKNQIHRVENINLEFLIENNLLSINRFENKIGDGRFFLRNEIKDNENDFMLGMLNLGQFYARSTSNGITVHIPSYFPHNTTGKVVIKGRNSEEAEITGPFDDIKIIGDLYLSNASVTYPPETENLFKLINIATEKRGETYEDPLPFELDLKLIAENQVRYVTYPLNLQLLSNSYIQLLYRNNEWIPEDAFFASESGSLDMFGTTFNLDYADFYINYELNDYRLKGVFFKYASDGSLITLDVFNEHDGSSANFFENMQFQLRSDNPEDRTTLHVLSKLRYNRRLEDIPRSQQSSLMQDEFLQLAGMGITGAIVDPFISPFINRTRHLLKLDFFSIKPSLVENLVNTYGFNEQGREPEEESEIIQFGKNILLNNLSIAMGKFVTQDLYLDYEFLLQKPVDVVGERDLLIYHNITFHYNLPYRLRVAYRFYLKPRSERNSHEIFFRRSFSFW